MHVKSESVLCRVTFPPWTARPGYHANLLYWFVDAAR